MSCAMNCLDLETVVPTRKGCAVSRPFSSRVTELAQLEQAVVTYAARMAEKPPRAGLATDHVPVFIHTSEHERSQYGRSEAPCKAMQMDGCAERLDQDR
jgi:DNA polymerase V